MRQHPTFWDNTRLFETTIIRMYLPSSVRSQGVLGWFQTFRKSQPLLLLCVFNFSVFVRQHPTWWDNHHTWAKSSWSPWVSDRCLIFVGGCLKMSKLSHKRSKIKNTHQINFQKLFKRLESAHYPPRTVEWNPGTCQLWLSHAVGSCLKSSGVVSQNTKH